MQSSTTGASDGSKSTEDAVERCCSKAGLIAGFADGNGLGILRPCCSAARQSPAPAAQWCATVGEKLSDVGAVCGTYTVIR